MTAEGKLRGTKKFHVKRKFFHLIFKKCGSGRMISNKIQKTFVSALLVPVCLAVCVMFLGLNLKIFADIGQKADYSYSLYLVHYPLAMCFVSLGVFEKMPGFAIFGVLGTSFLCAYMLESFQRKFFGIKHNTEAIK